MEVICLKMLNVIISPNIPIENVSMKEYPRGNAIFRFPCKSGDLAKDGCLNAPEQLIASSYASFLLLS